MSDTSIGKVEEVREREKAATLRSMGDFYGLTLLRADGRRGNEVRALKVDLARVSGVDGSQVDGSAWLSMGQTTVICEVRGPQEARRRSEEDPDKATLLVEVAVRFL